jgi:hypothetical protein
MTTRAMVMAFLLGALFTAVSHPGLAQNALGGAVKTKQSTVGGIAKPAPVVGGAATPAAVGTKPASIGGVAKPGSVAPTPGSPGIATNAAGSSTAKQTPPVSPPNKGGAVVTTSSSLKCAAGACVAKGTKP